MGMRLLLSKFCEYACKLENGRHSMIGIFDDIRVPEVPIDHPPFFLCLQLEYEAMETGSDLRLEAVFVDEDGGELFRTSIEGPIPKERGPGTVKVFVQIAIAPMRFERAGTHRLDVFTDDRKIGEERLPILVVSGEA